MSDESDFVLIGLLRRVHGLKGEVCVEPISDIAERFEALDYVLVRHGGKTSEEGAGMGVFTIYDWGNGAAAEAYNRMLDHFGPELVHRRK